VPLAGAVMLHVLGDEEHLGARRLAGLALGIVGVGALVGLDLGRVHTQPVAELLTVAVCYAAGPILFARKLGDAPALGVVAVSLGLTALAYVPVAVVQAPDHVPSAEVILSVLGLAIVCSGLAFVIFFALISEIGPARATVITYVNPAVAAILGIALLGEPFTTGLAVGSALVLAGSVLATRKASAAPAPAPAET
jgi:drug/metabolite transporter (DMT)-like permease